MFLVDTAEGRIIADEEIKAAAGRASIRIASGSTKIRCTLDDLPRRWRPRSTATWTSRCSSCSATFGYTLEDLRILMAPMATDGQEAIGSMGNDTPLAVLSDRPQLLYNYFKQLFAQVTNPPLDAIREEIVTSLVTTIGAEGNLLDETPEHCRLLRLEQPILTNAELEQIRQLDIGRAQEPARSRRCFRAARGPQGMRRRMDAAAAGSVAGDRRRHHAVDSLGPRRERRAGADPGAAGHQRRAPSPDPRREPHPLRTDRRNGRAREVHHFALLDRLRRRRGESVPGLRHAAANASRRLHARQVQLSRSWRRTTSRPIGKGLLKVMSKMGISTLHSYRGAQIFEAIGLNSEFVDEYFTRTASRIEGIGIEADRRRSRFAATSTPIPATECRRRSSWTSAASTNGAARAKRTCSTPKSSPSCNTPRGSTAARSFASICQLIDDQQRQLLTLRGLLEFKPAEHPVPLDEVEPAVEIVKRFATGAMSYGSISSEAHETLAIAMNRIGGKSNTGEGGEDPVRFKPDANGDRRNSAIKQVASGRFGVTSEYLVSAKELQIKMAQGAKPGEGGQLPGHKVDKEIARIRHSTPGVGLISPPPHHDIYSIEDLAQLIHDLKNANRDARIAVKLVAEVGVGTVAAGVAKGKADVVLISGHDGGTGASPLTSIKHAGIPWELGLAETHQVLVLNDLRGRIVVQTDGQLRTARDVAIATMLGAEEWGIATAALVTLGCIMMRKCHLNTCPVGIATQDPELRKKFAGKPEYVVNFFFLLAEELREIMAQLGFRTINEMVGRVDRLDTRKAIDHWKAKGLDFSAILHKPRGARAVKTYCAEPQDHGLEQVARHDDAARAVPAGARDDEEHGRDRPADPQRESHGRHDPLQRSHQALRPRRLRRTTRSQLNFRGTRRAELAGLWRARRHGPRRRRRQRLLRQGPLGRQDHRLPAARGARSCPRRTSSPATSCCTARPAAKSTCAASPASGSACAIAAPRPWSKASAITAANT